MTIMSLTSNYTYGTSGPEREPVWNLRILLEPRQERCIACPTMRSTSRTGSANSGYRTLAKLKAQSTEVTSTAKSDDIAFPTYVRDWYRSSH